METESQEAGPRRRFLVVDDSEDNRFLARHALLKAFPGAEVIEAATAEAAIGIAQSAHLDGVVTDHHLGDQDGAGFMQQLRDAGVRCPVVMVTASSDPRVHRRAYDVGAARVFAGSDWDFVPFFRKLMGP